MVLQHASQIPCIHNKIENSIKTLLRIGVKRILFVGIGNRLRNDDGVGVYISENINNHSQISALTVELNIENYIGKINTINPDLLVLIDCLDSGNTPGFYDLITAEQVLETTTHTHNISLKRLTEFFKMKTYILGIQPANLRFGENLSSQVLETANSIIQMINPQK